MTHVQLDRPGRENSCGDDVIIPCGSVKRHPQEHADPETVRHITVRQLNSQKFGNIRKKNVLNSLWDS